ncbi:LysR family transcriptional regulator [Gordonia jinghuaiqii]|uniref:LysR family transcriptional regulator n=1 Tax=Gordonia jinghuaiqii TaxID=2758710 RepID=A0A7D7LRJ4_9ACTN|nr:LysR family transcriptional regulator [Gordonia jinghuaiqii]MCR5978012.1 LysR family transcriptional regulator [Gordonia jinghuaiqii]QMT01520.1 LysR family transcriptional regulator [Gordonia jinghuaiqii]
MDASLRQLAAYVAVAKAASFTAAAAELHVSQSSLSRTVADLERVFGGQLLDRDTRNVALTPAGVEALRIAEQIINTHRAGMRELQQFMLGGAGTVSVATMPSIAAVVLPQVISIFKQRWPNVTVQILDGLERSVLKRVASGEADFAICTLGAPTAQLEHRPLVRDRFVAVLPAQHPLTTHRQVTWRELAEESFLAVGTDSSARRLADAAFAQVDAHTAPAAVASSVATVGGLVAAGLGVSAIPALVLPLMAPGSVEHRPLVDPIVERHLDIVHRRQHRMPLAAQHFLEVLEEARELDLPLGEGAAWAPRPA